MKKSDIETHSAYHYGPELPALIVKMYSRDRNPPGACDVAERFHCSEKAAEQALGFWFESAREMFWRETAPDIAREIFGPGAKIYSAGRSSGWLVVDGLPPLASWDALAVTRWARFTRLIDAEVAGQCEPEAVFSEIEVNEWTRDGAELYNFADVNGKTECIADLKARAIAAGFGPVVR